LSSVQGWHSAHNPLPSVQWWHSAKYIEIIFAECHQGDTRQRELCRVSDREHLAKIILKLKKIFAECPIADTRQRALLLLSLSLSYRAAVASPPRPRRPAAVPSLPSPTRRALARPPPKCTPGKCTRPTSNPRALSRPRPNLQGDCLLSFCDIVIKKLYVLYLYDL
jgi:hypothetical protein